LQKAIENYGLDKFHIYVYEYFIYENKMISSKALTDLETSYISKFNLRELAPSIILRLRLQVC